MAAPWRDANISCSMRSKLSSTMAAMKHANRPGAPLKRYANRTGQSGVRQFAIGPEAILIEFANGVMYLYDYTTPGERDVERMKALALKGAGLSTYISRHVRDRYAHKLSRAA
jgi:hypothetical protein